MSFKKTQKIAHKDDVLVVDALNFAFRWKHMGRTDFRFDYVAAVRSFATSFQCNRIIILADKGQSSYRLGVDPEYKANRKEKIENQTEEEAAAFQEFIHEFYETLAELEKDYTVLQYKGVEADDTAAFLVKNKEEFGFRKMMLLSTDRDWDLLLNDEVSRFSYGSRKEFNMDNWLDEHNVLPEDYISQKCLMGDLGDNVPGIAGVGPVKSAQIIDTFGSALDIYDQLPLPGKYKYIQEINKSGERLMINYELMDLLTFCEDAIGADNLADIRMQLLEH